MIHNDVILIRLCSALASRGLVCRHTPADLQKSPSASISVKGSKLKGSGLSAASSVAGERLASQTILGRNGTAGGGKKKKKKRGGFSGADHLMKCILTNWEGGGGDRDRSPPLPTPSHMLAHLCSGIVTWPIVSDPIQGDRDTGGWCTLQLCAREFLSFHFHSEYLKQITVLRFYFHQSLRSIDTQL